MREAKAIINYIHTENDAYNETSLKIYRYNIVEDVLRAVTENIKDISFAALVFTDFQTFRHYIAATNPAMRIFTQNKTMYLFCPVFDENNKLYFLVFSKDKVTFDDVIAVGRSKGNKNNTNNK